MPTKETAVTVLEHEEVSGAYKAIVDFFSCYTMPKARKYIAKTIKAAIKGRGWTGKNPADVIYFYDMMEKLVKAAFVLSHNKSKRTKAIQAIDLMEGPDPTNLNAYCGRHVGYGPWAFFPRFLGKYEYCDPYRALKKVAASRSHKEWKEYFRMIVFYSVNTDSYPEFQQEMEPLEVYLLLNKLLEACHLIDVRAINEVDGCPRPKWRDKERPAREVLNAASDGTEIEQSLPQNLIHGNNTPQY